VNGVLANDPTDIIKSIIFIFQFIKSIEDSCFKAHAPTEDRLMSGYNVWASDSAAVKYGG